MPVNSGGGVVWDEQILWDFYSWKLSNLLMWSNSHDKMKKLCTELNVWSLNKVTDYNKFIKSSTNTGSCSAENKRWGFYFPWKVERYSLIKSVKYRVFEWHFWLISTKLVSENTFFVNNGMQFHSTHFHIQSLAFNLCDEPRLVTLECGKTI